MIKIFIITTFIIITEIKMMIIMIMTPEVLIIIIKIFMTIEIGTIDQTCGG